MTSAVVRPDAIDEVDFTLQPACQVSVWFTDGWHIFGRDVRWGRRLLSKDHDCPNSAVWVGLRRCCGKTLAVCDDCRQLTKDTLGCKLCNKFKKPPRWRKL